jgi:hypothetical protein
MYENAKGFEEKKKLKIIFVLNNLRLLTLFEPHDDVVNKK